MESTAQYPAVLYTLIVTTVPFVFAKKNAGSPQFFLLICLVVVIAISATANGWSGSILTLVPAFFASAIVPFVLFSKLIDTPKKHKTILFISVLAALLMVHNGMSQKASDLGVGWAGNRLSEGTRITYLGTLGDPNDLGMFLVMMLPFAAYFMAYAKSMLKIIWFLALLALLYGVFLTNSRGAFLGVLSLLGLWALERYGVKKSVAIALLLLPVIFVVASKFRTIDAEEESAQGRIDAWYQGFQMLIHQPLFGVGMSNFTQHNVLTAHNSYVLIAAELGFIGFFTWMSFILLTFFMLYQVAFYNKSIFKKTISDTQMASEVLSSDVLDEILLAKSAFFSMMGFVVTAFFLSRSYTFVLYIYAGVGVSGYYRALSVMPSLSPITLGALFFRLLSLSFAIIVFLYIVVRVLK